jgi:xanthine/uracil permease
MMFDNGDNINKRIGGIDKWVLCLFIGAQILHTALITFCYGAYLLPYQGFLPHDALEVLFCGLICIAVLFIACLKLKYALPWVWGICLLTVFDLLCYTGLNQWIPRFHLDDLLLGIPHIIQLALVFPAFIVLIRKRRAFCINLPILIGLLIACAILIISVYLRAEYFPVNEPLWGVEPPLYYKRLTVSDLNYPQEKSLALLLLSFVAYYCVYELAIRRQKDDESIIQ